MRKLRPLSRTALNVRNVWNLVTGHTSVRANANICIDRREQSNWWVLERCWLERKWPNSNLFLTLWRLQNKNIDTMTQMAADGISAATTEGGKALKRKSIENGSKKAKRKKAADGSSSSRWIIINHISLSPHVYLQLNSLIRIVHSFCSDSSSSSSSSSDDSSSSSSGDSSSSSSDTSDSDSDSSSSSDSDSSSSDSN